MKENSTCEMNISISTVPSKTSLIFSASLFFFCKSPYNALRPSLHGSFRSRLERLSTSWTRQDVQAVSHCESRSSLLAFFSPGSRHLWCSWTTVYRSTKFSEWFRTFSATNSPTGYRQFTDRKPTVASATGMPPTVGQHFSQIEIHFQSVG